MRVAVIVQSFPSISQTFVRDQIHGLLDAGLDVDVWAWWAGPWSGSTANSGGSRDLTARTRYFGRVPRSVFSRLARGLVSVGAGLVQAPRSTVRCLRPDIMGSSAASLRAVLEFAPLRPGRSYDAILCHFGPVGRLAIRMRAAGLLDGPIATVFHGFDMSREIRERGAGVYRDLFEQGELFLPISERWRARLVELGADSSKVLVHRMGVRSDRLTWRARRLADGEPLRLVSVARLVEKKGLADAIAAVGLLRDRGVGVRYTIVGDGPLRSDLESLVARLGLSGLVHFEGWCDHERVLALLDESHLLLAPSVVADDGDEEGIPVALMESMAMGLPVVTTRHSGIPELVADPDHGRLVDERDPAALAAAVQDLLADQARWPAIAEAARATIAAEFDQRTLNARLSRMLQDLAAGHARPRG